MRHVRRGVTIQRSRHPYIRGHCRSTTVIGDDYLPDSRLGSRALQIFISRIKYSTWRGQRILEIRSRAGAPRN